MLNGRSVLVVGAGIGGLAAALALHRQGAEVTVLERADAIREVGAGLQISQNGAVVLRALGLLDAVTATAIRGEAVVLRDYRRPGVVLRLDLQRRQDRVHLFVHRADLIGVLEQAVRGAGIPIRLGAEVEAVQPGAQPSVAFAGGEVLAADLVIGADGVRSKARIALNGADAPFFTGHMAWRAVITPDKPLPPEAQLVMAPGKHAVAYPLRDGRQANLAAFQERREWTAEGWNHPGDPVEFRDVFRDVKGEMARLINAVETVSVWGLFRHPVAPVWAGDNVVLLGDAAHPTLPYLAQGANLALEDAWVLARCLAGETGAEGYQEERRPRALRVIEAANRYAWKYHVRFGPARRIGHMGLRLAGAVAPDVMLGQFDWIYGHDVTR